MQYLNKQELMEKLKELIEIHGKTTIVDLTEGIMKMHILHAKNQSKTLKDKMILDKLLRIDERLLNSSKEISAKDSIIVEFLIEESMKYYVRSKKK